jgi:hypothetical protein
VIEQDLLIIYARSNKKEVYRQMVNLFIMEKLAFFLKHLTDGITTRLTGQRKMMVMMMMT